MIRLRFVLPLFALFFLMFTPSASLAQTGDFYINNLPSKTTLSAEKQSVQQELERVVQEIVQLGHLAPTLYQWRLGEADLYYLTPSDTLYALSISYPYLSPGLQNSLKSYLANEIVQYPPHSTAMYDNMSCCDQTKFKGARREYFPSDINTNFNIWPGPTIHPSVLYSIWAYSYYTNDWSYAQQNYSAIQSLYQSQQSTYPDIAGVIGFGRIAKHLDRMDDYNTAVFQLNQVLTANAQFSQFEQEARSRYVTSGAHNFVVPLFQTNNKSKSFHFNRDLGLLLKNTAKNQATNFAQELCSDVPLCWLTAPGISHGENMYAPPEVSWTYMMIEGYVNGASTQKLQTLLDRPDRKGDLFYIQKLVMALEAPSDGSPQTTLTPTTAPAVCATDINQDGSTDLLDYSLLVANFFSTTPGNRSDINTDGVVDLTDYSLLVTKFLQPCL